jgi:hypothetical protein
LLFRWAGSRPVKTTLVVAPPWTTVSSINLSPATPVLPIATARPRSPTLRPLLKAPINALQQQTASAEIPITSDAKPRHTSRGFFPWRFADASPRCAWHLHHGPASANLHMNGHGRLFDHRVGAGEEGGIVRPISLAAFRLITSSNRVGCSTGSSAGLPPLRIFAT